MKSPFATVWFWFMVIGVSGIIASILCYEFLGEASENNTTGITPWWIYFLFCISLFILIISFIFYCMWIKCYNKELRCCKKLNEHTEENEDSLATSRDCLDECDDPCAKPCEKPCAKPCDGIIKSGKGLGRH